MAEDEWLDFDDEEDAGASRKGEAPPPPDPTSRPGTKSPPPPPPPDGTNTGSSSLGQSSYPSSPPEDRTAPSPGPEAGPQSTEQPSPSSYPSSPPEKVPLNAGSYLGAVAIIILIIGLLLPWYVVGVEAEGEGFDTDGRVDILKLGGINGIQLNIPEGGGNNTTAPGNLTADDIQKEMVNSVPVLGTCCSCFTLVVLVAVVLELVVLVVHLRDRKRKRGNRLIWHGLLILLPIIIVLLLLPMIVSHIFSMTEAPAEIRDVVETIVSSPARGQNTFVFGGEEVTFYWEFGLGLWLIITGGALTLISGVIDRLLAKPASDSS